jgi:uncharacterized protein YjiS (DUF1127 family)
MTTLRMNTLIDDSQISEGVYSATQRIEAAYLSIVGTVSTWIHRSTERQQLASMNDYMLSDIGLTRFDAQIEADKFFWQK